MCGGRRGGHKLEKWQKIKTLPEACPIQYKRFFFICFNMFLGDSENWDWQTIVVLYCCMKRLPQSGLAPV